MLEPHRRLASRLARHPRPDPADRYLPHLTLCRFTRGGASPRLTDPVDLPPIPISRVHLMRSVLRPDGAEHRELAAFDLD